MAAMTSPIALDLLAAARELSDTLRALRFAPPVAHVYDPLQYAFAPYRAYVERFGATRKRIVFLGMNPGPFGMMQTGVPFGEVAAVRDWMGIGEPVEPPARQHPKRPIEGFDCTRSEVSGRRLWGWAALRFGTAGAFFRDRFVLNYCPLVFLEASGRNLTPDRLPALERRAAPSPPPATATWPRHCRCCSPNGRSGSVDLPNAACAPCSKGSRWIRRWREVCTWRRSCTRARPARQPTAAGPIRWTPGWRPSAWDPDPAAQSNARRALWNMRIHGLWASGSPLLQLICRLRNTRSGCGISTVKRPSAVVTAVRPSGLPLGLAG